jgi:hypothetical protein
METETNVVCGTSWNVGTLPDHGSELVGLEVSSGSLAWHGSTSIKVPILVSIEPLLGSSVGGHQVISSEVHWLIVVLTAVLVLVGSLVLGGSREGSRTGTVAEGLDKLSLGCLSNRTVVGQVWGSVTGSSIVMSEDRSLVVADVDGVINAVGWVTGSEDVGLECGWGLWCVSSGTVPSIDESVLDTESYPLSCCSLPDHLGELQSAGLSGFRVGLSCGEVVVPLSCVPFISCLTGSEDLEGTCTLELALSTVLEFCWSISWVLHFVVGVQHLLDCLGSCCVN